MNDLSNTIISEFKRASNGVLAPQMAAYMKNNFDFFGVKSPLRNNIQKPFMIKKYLIHKLEMINEVKILWNEPQRELQYFAQEYVYKYINTIDESDIYFYEWLIINKSWWDTVDFIAPKLVGNYFMKYPQNKELKINKWINSNNIWLQRSAILFQLKYKSDTDTEFLASIINSLNGSNEFFINKAIGWVLREYGKTNPHWVENFCSKTELSKLSQREALRIIVKDKNIEV